MNSEKQKILIVISGNLFIRNNILTEAFEELGKKFDCYYMVSKNVTQTHSIELKPNFLGFYKISKHTKKISQKLFDSLMWKNRKKSSSF